MGHGHHDQRPVGQSESRYVAMPVEAQVEKELIRLAVLLQSLLRDFSLMKEWSTFAIFAEKRPMVGCGISDQKITRISCWCLLCIICNCNGSVIVQGSKVLSFRDTSHLQHFCSTLEFSLPICNSQNHGFCQDTFGHLQDEQNSVKELRFWTGSLCEIWWNHAAKKAGIAWLIGWLDHRSMILYFLEFITRNYHSSSWIPVNQSVEPRWTKNKISIGFGNSLQGVSQREKQAIGSITGSIIY